MKLNRQSFVLGVGFVIIIALAVWSLRFVENHTVSQPTPTVSPTTSPTPTLDPSITDEREQMFMRAVLSRYPTVHQLSTLQSARDLVAYFSTPSRSENQQIISTVFFHFMEEATTDGTPDIHAAKVRYNYVSETVLSIWLPGMLPQWQQLARIQGVE